MLHVSCHTLGCLLYGSAHIEGVKWNVQYIITRKITMLNNHVAVVLDLVLFVVVVVALLNYYVRFAFFWIWFSMLYWTLLVHRLLLSVLSTHKTSLSDGILAAYQSPGHAQSLQPAITCVSVNQNGFHRNCISFIRRSRIHRIAGLNLWSCLRCRLQSASCQSGSASEVTLYYISISRE